MQAFATNNGLEVKSTFEAFSANFNAFAEAGARDTQKQIEFVSTIIAAEASKGISGQRALIDAIDLVNGRFSRLTFAKEIGVTEEGFKKAAASGQQLDYILGKLGGYKEGISDYANSFAGTSQQVHELTTQLEGLLLKGSMGPLKEGLSAIVTLLKDPTLRENVENVGSGIGKVVSGAEKLGSSTGGATALKTAFAQILAPLELVVSGLAKLGEADPLKAQLDTNAKLIDLATTQEQQDRVRLTLRKQLVVAIDEENTAAVNGLKAQLAGLDTNLGKHRITADTTAEVTHLTEDQRAALEGIGAALDAANLKEQDKTAQLQAQKAALEKQVSDAAAFVGLQESVVAGIRTAADFQQVSTGLTEKQKATLAEYLTGIIQTREEVGKLTAAQEKQATEREKQVNQEREKIANVNERLGEQIQKLKDIAAGNVKATPNEVLKVQQDILKSINEQIEATLKLAKAQIEQAKANEAAHPQEVARRNANQQYLESTKLTPDHPEHSEEELEGRRRAQQYIDQDNATISGKSPASPSRPAVDLADPANRVYPEERGQRDSDLSTPSTPLPSDFGGGGYGGYGDSASKQTKSAQDLSDASQKADDAAGKVADAAGKLPTSIGQLGENLSTFASGVQTNLDKAAGVLEGHQGQLESLETRFAQLALRVNSIANAA